ncbi:hypothetical protein HMPREF3293_01893 [Christensenella minuta]|uniref:Uncharacterized protein n=1 Tax=Christensenella minuta TaxID=626937 RepID=A0A136Q3N9_9FIRM|nr:hypothetical protein HMPREF3293_01893 [Christensenella minuta]
MFQFILTYVIKPCNPLTAFKVTNKTKTGFIPVLQVFCCF